MTDYGEPFWLTADHDAGHSQAKTAKACFRMGVELLPHTATNHCWIFVPHSETRPGSDNA